ncbi:MAG: aldo/keto reductase [Phycisphaerales bacterium]
MCVSPIGLGTVKLGRDRGLKYAAPVTIPSDDEALQLLRTAHELGVNLIDTAPAYGTSEERLGKLLYTVAPREAWILCTKAGEEFDPTSATSRYDFSPAAITTSVERSLRRLGTDVLDVVLLHFGGSDDSDAKVLARGEAIGALRDLQRRGNIRCVGASTGTAQGARLAVEHGDVVMLTLNPGVRQDLPWIEAARLRGRGVLIKKPLGSGHATDPAATLRMVLGTPGVTSAVVGTSSSVNLRANVAAVE